MEHTLYKLDRVGYTVKREKAVDPSNSAFKNETQMAELAMQEHDRWNDERLLDGREVGKPTNRKQKIHETWCPGIGSRTTSRIATTT